MVIDEDCARHEDECSVQWIMCGKLQSTLKCIQLKGTANKLVSMELYQALGCNDSEKFRLVGMIVTLLWVMSRCSTPK